jgi:hypothetical protein
MIQRSVFLAGCFAFLVAPSGAMAQSSFSTNSYRLGPVETLVTAPDVTYDGGRLFFADGRHHLKILGCEFVLNQNIVENTPWHSFLKSQRETVRARPESGPMGAYMNVSAIGELTNGRRLEFTGERSRGVECDTGPGSAHPLYMVGTREYLFKPCATCSTSIKDEIALVIVWNKETAISKATSQFDPTSAMVLFLKKDLFTPQQEDQALKMTGEVGLAIFRALIRR